MPIQKMTKEEILWGSARVFRRKGYYRASMSDLSKEIGLTKGAFYHHFNDKKTVMLEALSLTTAWFERKIFSIAYEKSLPSKERLQIMTDNAYRAFTDNPGGCFFANTILETAHVEDTFREVIIHFFSVWENALLEIFKDGYSEEEAQEIAVQTITEVEGAIVLMQLHQDPIYLKKAFDRNLKRL